jgi:hypothetical protein
MSDIRSHEIGRFGYVLVCVGNYKATSMQPLKTFMFGASYLFSGVYTLGLSMYLGYKLLPVSGYVALVTVPDALFPYEVLLFVAIGVTFIMAALLEFRETVRIIEPT